MEKLIECLQKLGFDRVAELATLSGRPVWLTETEMGVKNVLETYFSGQIPLSAISNMTQDYRKAENRALRYVDALRQFDKHEAALDAAYADLEAANKIDDRGAIDTALSILVRADRTLVTTRLSLYEQEGRMKDLSSSLLPKPFGTVYPDETDH